MQASTQLGPDRLEGEARRGALFAACGLLVLISVGGGLWPAAGMLPVGIGAALLVFGAHQAAPALTRKRSAPLIAGFDGHPEPVFATDRRGRPTGRNAAAPREGLLEHWSDEPGALAFRLLNGALSNGMSSETVSGGQVRISVTRAGNNALLWRVERDTGSDPGQAALAENALPWLRLDPEGAVLELNDAARGASGIEAPERFDAVVADGPLRPGDVHRLAGSGRSCRAVVVAQTARSRDVVLVPLDASDAAGSVPDHFLEELPVALLRLTPTGDLLFANRQARALLGDGAEPGQNLGDLIEGLGRSIAERLQDTVKGRALGRSEVARGKAAGQEIFLQVAFARAMLDGAATLIAVLSDATELKTLEAQFVQSQKMQAVGQLAGGVAHDFNNLLTAINGHCDLLLMRHDVADVEHGDLMQIRQNANRAAALVRQLLAFSRKQTLRPTVINLQDTLSELTHLLNRLLSEKVTLKIEHAPDLHPVRVDERQLEQVIMNLVVNARDAMPRGGEVRIRTRNLHLDADVTRDRAVLLKGDYVVIEVADSGSGIPADKLNKIFDPFFTTKPVGEGTGLGLSTAYGIIKQTGGFIFAESPAGRGAVFSIYLPAYEAVEVEAPAEPEPARPRDLSGRGLVLLVEDEDAVRSFAARALQLRGYTVMEACSGEEALEILKDEALQVDVMVSDVIMPGLDGPAWVREARKTRPNAKVIFVSGYAEDAFAGGDTGIPNSVFLPKPFTLPELTQRVKDLLDA